MKTIGLIGGTTWHSTVDYYRIINQEVNKKLGGVSSAKIIMYSFDFDEINKLTSTENWTGFSAMFCNAAQLLEKAGADFLLICANTPYKFADDIRKVIHIPLIHIAEVTASEIEHKGLKKVGLLGTRFTMEESFFKDKLTEKNIEKIIPEKEEREFIHSSIFDELGKGIFTSETKNRYLNIINELIHNGAEGIILGCTEIPLIIKQEDCYVPVFDTITIHAAAAVEFSLKS